MKTKLLTFIILISLFVSQIGKAQTAEKKIALGINGIKTEYKGDLGNGLFKFSPTTYYAGGLTLAAYLNRSFNVGISADYGDYGYSDNTLAKAFNSQKLDANLYFQYKFANGYILKETCKLSPFITLGAGIANYSKTRLDELAAIHRTDVNKGTDVIVPVGVGLKYQITSSFAIQYQYVYNFTNHDLRDGKVDWHNGKVNIGEMIKDQDQFGQHQLGVVFSFGKAKDTDKDGIADKFDKCPDTPAGVKVDELGCPVDTDGDGVADYLDKCPNTPAGVKVDAKGCPVDSDGDGVADYLDKCPNTPAGTKVDAKGCPADSDGDGVADYLDKCPDTPTGVKVDTKGCPIDSDGDGVADYLDKCPNTPKNVKVDANGCPIDTDGDGVPDYLDKCPKVAGIAANKGCPEVKQETKKVFAQALQGIQFETGKDVIRKSSFSILDKVVKVMGDNPEYNLEVNGHTDNVGNSAKNQALSDKRAAAVKAYLVKKGVSESRLTSNGYGDTKPVADNKTAKGKALNRRVEFKVNF